MSTVALLVQLALIAFFIPSALLKLIGHPHMRKEFSNFRYPYWLARLAGLIELAAGALLVGGLWHVRLSAIGALLLVPVMIGATWTNFVKRPAAFGWGTAVILVLCGGLSIYRLVTEFDTVCFSAAAVVDCFGKELRFTGGAS